MKLTPKERERLTIFMAAELARRRRERSVKLNHPESVALISDWACERAREGMGVAEIRSAAQALLTEEDVMEGVPEMIDTVQVEPTFPDGTKLVTIHDPIRFETAEQADEMGLASDGGRPTGGESDDGGPGEDGGDGS